MAMPPHTNFRYRSNSREREGLMFSFYHKGRKVKIRKDRKVCSIRTTKDERRIDE